MTADTLADVLADAIDDDDNVTDISHARGASGDPFMVVTFTSGQRFTVAVRESAPRGDPYQADLA